MNNRLQFRHDNHLYGSFEEIKNAVAAKELELLNQPESERDNRMAALYAEPTIFKYGNEEEPSLVLAVGSVGSGVANTDNTIYFIDIDTIKGQIKDLQDKDAKVEEIIEGLSAGTMSEVARLDAKIEDETKRAEDAEAVLSADTVAEQKRAEAEEDRINTIVKHIIASVELDEKGNIQVDAEHKGIHPLHEYPLYFKNDSTILDILINLASGLTQEKTDRDDAIKSAVTSAVTVLSAATVAEQERAKAEEAVLSDNIVAEQERAVEEEIDLQKQISANTVYSSNKTIIVEPEAHGAGTSIKVNIDGDSIISSSTGTLSVRPNALTQYSGNSKAIVVSGNTAEKMIDLVLNPNNKFLYQDDNGLYGKLELVYDKEGDGSSAITYIDLYGYTKNDSEVNRNLISRLDTSIFTKEEFLKDAELIESYDKDPEGTGITLPYLKLTWESTEGPRYTRIPVSSLVDTYTAGEGIEIKLDESTKAHKISVKIDDNLNEVIDGTSSSKYLNVGDEGLYVKGINAAIESEEERASLAEDKIADAIGIDKESLDYKIPSDSVYISATTSVTAAIHVLDVTLRDTNATLSNETTRATTAEAALQNNIDTLSANTVNKINTVSGDIKTTIDAEKTERTTSDNNLASAIETEATTRISEDAKLLGTTSSAIEEPSIWGVKNALEQEISDRAADVDAEEAARIADVDQADADRKAGDDKLAKLLLGENATSENAAFTFSAYTDVAYVKNCTNAIDSIHILDTKIQAISGSSTQADSRIKALEDYKTNTLEPTVDQVVENTAKLETIEAEAQVNKLETITVNNSDVAIIDKNASLSLTGYTNQIEVTGDNGKLTVKVADAFIQRIQDLETKLAAAEAKLAEVYTFYKAGFMLNSVTGKYEMQTSIVLADDVVKTNNIANAQITADKLASDAVTTVKIVDGAVTTAKIADGDKGVNTIDLANNLVLDGGVIDENS